MTELHRLAQRLKEEPQRSRNRYFDELSQPMAMRARRVIRRLAGLERDLLAGGEIAVRRTPMGYAITIAFPQVRARRETFLTFDEYALLVADERLRALLAGDE